MKLSVNYLGIPFENPFVLASAPPTANEEMISRAFHAGWAGAVVKTLIKEPVHNLQNRFASMKADNKIIGFENIELLSELKPETWYEQIRSLKQKFPEKRIIGSVMGDAKDPSPWKELTLGCQESGADLVELNFSCPHGYPERGKGAAIGQSAEYSSKIVQWLKEDSRIKIPLIPKLTAATTDISFIGEAVAQAGAHGISAINTIPSLMGFNLKTLKAMPSVNGYTTFGGYSGPGIKPIALRCVANLAQNPGLPIMACGGISSGYDAAEFLLLGAPIIQICTAVMLEGYGIIHRCLNELQEFMKWHNFTCIEDFLGKGLNQLTQYQKLDLQYKVKAHVDPIYCIGCGKCAVSCRDAATQSIEMQNHKAVVSNEKCVGCSLCYQVCPQHAISMIPC